MASARVQFWVAAGVVAVVYGLPLAVIALDLWLIQAHGYQASISRVVLAAQRRQPTLVVTVPFAVGLATATVVTHLFLYQQVR